MNIKQVLRDNITLLKQNNIEEANLKAKILLCYTLNVRKEYLIIHDEQEIIQDDIKRYNEYIQRIIRNEPIQYITKNQEFMGLDFFVDNNVLIPRQDTEVLVEEVITILKENKKAKVLDLCTGSGAIGISIAKNIENVKLVLSDISSKALEVARKNCIKNEIDFNNVEILESNLFNNIQNKFDLIVSNPPYIRTDVIQTLEKQVQQEPKIALDGGIDGLEIYREIIENAYNYLENRGYLCLEIGYDQKTEVIELIKKTNKYENIYSKKDLNDNDRVIICRRR